jgi:hypothetical protein
MHPRDLRRARLAAERIDRRQGIESARVTAGDLGKLIVDPLHHALGYRRAGLQDQRGRRVDDTAGEIPLVDAIQHRIDIREHAMDARPARLFGRRQSRGRRQGPGRMHIVRMEVDDLQRVGHGLSRRCFNDKMYNILSRTKSNIMSLLMI